MLRKNRLWYEKFYTTKKSLKKPLIEEYFFKNCLNYLCCSPCFNFNFLKKSRSHCEMYFCSTINWYIIDLTQKKWNYILFNPQSFVWGVNRRGLIYCINYDQANFSQIREKLYYFVISRLFVLSVYLTSNNYYKHFFVIYTPKFYNSLASSYFQKNYVGELKCFSNTI